MLTDKTDETHLKGQAITKPVFANGSGIDDQLQIKHATFDECTE